VADLGRILKPGTLVAEAVDSPQALQALETQWQDLADHAVEPNPFYEPWMALPVLEQLGSTRVQVVLVHAPHPSGRKGERLLCGLFPLERRSRHGVRYLQGWRHPYCYLGNPLLRQGCAAEALDTFLTWLEAQAPKEGPWRLCDVAGGGETRRLLVDALHAREWGSVLDPGYTRAFFRPAEDPDAFFKRAPLGGRRRKELRRLEARLAEQGRLEYRALEELSDLPRWVAAFVELESGGWKGRAEVAVCSRAERLRFFEAMARRAFLLGRLQMLSLELDGRPLAMKVNLSAHDGGVAFKIAYDEAYARFSPGVLLELENIRTLHASGCAWMDSCAAPNRFMINQLWPDRVEIQSVWVVPPRARGAWIASALPLWRLLSRRVHALGRGGWWRRG
jgi:CelD/BcsL family acetyltransferase involved in cellulose biosynthesis